MKHSIFLAFLLLTACGSVDERILDKYQKLVPSMEDVKTACQTQIKETNAQLGTPDEVSFSKGKYTQIYRAEYVTFEIESENTCISKQLNK